MRIQTDGDKAYRKDVIEDAAEFWECNNTDAVVKSCDLAGRVLPQLVNALEAADIRPSEKKKLVVVLNTRNVSVDLDRESIGIYSGESEVGTDIIDTDMTDIQSDGITDILALVTDIRADFRDGAPIEEVLARAREDLGIERSKTKQKIKELKKQGELYERKTGWLTTA